MTIPNTLSALWGASALAFAVTPVSAQASGNSSLQGCGNAAQEVADGTATYNATGTTSFSLPIADDDWYLTQTLRDERGENRYFGGSRSMQSFNVFLSLPESFISSRRGNATDYCVYLMYGRNETSDAEPGDGNNSCEGVLSDECANALRDVPSPQGDSCPFPDVRDECGFVPWLTRTVPNNFTETRCALDDVPGVNLPDGYRSFDTKLSVGLPDGDSSRDSFEVYDLRVQQPIPVLISVRDRESGAWATEVICLAPSNVTEGSREPEAEFPPSAATMQRAGAGVVLLVAALAGITSFVV